MTDKEFQDRVLEKLDSHEDKFDKFDDKFSKTIYGNGQVGMKTRLANVEQVIKFQGKAFWGIYAAILTIVGKIIFF